MLLEFCSSAARAMRVTLVDALGAAFGVPANPVAVSVVGSLPPGSLPGPTISTTTNVASAVASTPLLATNATRGLAVITNRSPGGSILYVRFGSGGGAGTGSGQWSYAVLPGYAVEVDGDTWAGPIEGAWDVLDPMGYAEITETSGAPVPPGPISAFTTGFAVSVVSIPLLAPNPNRALAVITNRSPAGRTLYVAFGAGPATTAAGGWSYVILPGQALEIEGAQWAGEVQGIWDGPDGAGYAEVTRTIGATVIAGTSAITSSPSALVSAAFLPADPTRILAVIKNQGAAQLYLAFGAGPASTAPGGWAYLVPPGQMVEIPRARWAGAIYGIWDAVSGYAEITTTSP